MYIMQFEFLRVKTCTLAAKMKHLIKDSVDLGEAAH